MWTSLPSMKTSPLSKGKIPAIPLIKVDLPAPLSPTRAITSPRRTSKSTSESACTAPKALETPLHSRSGAVAAIPTLPGRAGDGAPGDAPSRFVRLCVLLAEVRLRDVPGADLLDRPEAVGDHGVGNVVRRDRDRDECEVRHDAVARGRVGRLAVRRVDADQRELDVGLDVVDVLAGPQRERHGRGDLRLGLDRLVDAHRLLAEQDVLHPCGRRVLAADRNPA